MNHVIVAATRQQVGAGEHKKTVQAPPPHTRGPEPPDGDGLSLKGSEFSLRVVPRSTPPMECVNGEARVVLKGGQATASAEVASAKIMCVKGILPMSRVSLSSECSGLRRRRR